ncbi:hypothetical protein [Citrobacter freundii]|uniref:hypothetical protein n=1 Tax=Citrobacter freundii TaxID=546 RepID=UPI0015FF6364|nr:hypothetical protein [Citrobacter freundii]EKW5623042.1 hypothetical protein [Citrobacter freundii]QNB20130.1 hypothetical protein HS092_12400 [Citrobacter freundii]
MSNTYAVVDKGIVTNLVAWDGKSDWEPETGKAVPVKGACGIGWEYDGKSFNPPATDSQTT